MCGIAGFLRHHSHSRAEDRELLSGMCAQIAHRGPDAEGMYFNGGTALGHRRLSIIDVSGGEQPLGNEDGTVQVVFNGEIYNFLELRADLARKGHQFRTRSDTEVLVHLYEEHGEAMPEFLNGMYAFAIWDARRQYLLLARDRLGKKPLYYSMSMPAMRLCFASEAKALLAVPGFSPQLNEKAVADFLSLSYVPEPETIYRNVLKLPPAHTLLVTPSGSRLRRYWAPQFTDGSGKSLDATVEELRCLAADSVSRRMISDVPLGAFLSGGVDSSAVVGFMARNSAEPIKTYSIGFNDKRFDELAYARMAAEQNATDHREEVVTPEIFEMLDTLVKHFDEPFGDSSAIPMLYLSRMTRRYVTVALSGDGADELFGGYRRYYFGVLEEKLREKFPGWFRRSVIHAGAQCYPKFDFLPRPFRAKTLLGNLSQEIGDAYFTSMSTFRDGDLNSILACEMASSLKDYSPREEYRKRFAAVAHLHPLQQMQAVDFETYLPGDILVKADRTTMAYSLESRSPWLDYRLAELACSMPPGMKLHGRTGKYAFRKAVEPYVPASLLRRTKMGFSVPLASWFRGSLKELFESSVLGSEGLFSRAEARRIWQEHQSGVCNHDRKLWNLLMLALWHTRYLGADSSRVLSAAGAR
jgi:asparagine synthase (glutamine-hydrolysing)